MSSRAKTNRRTIGRAALQVVEEAGLDGVTIRSVARVAGVSPMTLYTYIGSKAELFELMREGVVYELYPNLDEVMTWQAALRSVCHHLRELVLEHPQWAPFVELPAPVRLPERERVLSLLTAGCTAPEALLSAALLPKKPIVMRAKQVAFALATVELNHRAEPELRLGELFDSVVDTFIARVASEVPGLQS